MGILCNKNSGSYPTLNTQRFNNDSQLFTTFVRRLFTNYADLSIYNFVLLLLQF